jgi:BarA-like signal transduction histidine kinase
MWYTIISRLSKIEAWFRSTFSRQGVHLYGISGNITMYISFGIKRHITNISEKNTVIFVLTTQLKHSATRTAQRPLCACLSDHLKQTRLLNTHVHTKTEAERMTDNWVHSSCPFGKILKFTVMFYKLKKEYFMQNFLWTFHCVENVKGRDRLRYWGA